MSTTRLEAFSDGVFAIAITLLVLDIHVPSSGSGRLAHDLVHQWPQYAAYVVSFITIGIIWVNHHAQLERIVRADRTLLFLNLGLLLWVALIPFPTALTAHYLRHGTNQHVAAAVYAATLLMMGLSFFAMWRYAAARGMVAEDLTPADIRRLVVRNVVGQGCYVAAVGLAFVSAGVSLGLCFLAAAYYVLPGRVGHPEGHLQD